MKLAITLCVFAGILADFAVHPLPAQDEKPTISAKVAVPTLTDTKKLEIRNAQHELDQLNLRYSALQQQEQQLQQQFMQRNTAYQTLLGSACGDEQFGLDPEKLECVRRPGPPTPAAGAAQPNK